MPFQLKPPVEATYYLDETDAEYLPDVTNDDIQNRTFVVVRQATQLQHEKRSKIFEEMTSRFHNDTNVAEVITRWCYPELQRIETFLTLKECNIRGEDGELLFKYKDGRISSADFDKAWGSLPHLICNEIHSKVLEVNPTWGKLGEV